VTNVTIVPSAEFSLTNPLNTPFTVKPGLTERFSINFEASSSSASAVLQIASNTAGGTVKEITLQGPALAPQDQKSRPPSTVEIKQDPHTDFSHLSLRLEQTSAQPVPYRLKIVGKEQQMDLSGFSEGFHLGWVHVETSDADRLGLEKSLLSREAEDRWRLGIFHEGSFLSELPIATGVLHNTKPVLNCRSPPLAGSWLLATALACPREPSPRSSSTFLCVCRPAGTCLMRSPDSRSIHRVPHPSRRCAWSCLSDFRQNWRRNSFTPRIPAPSIPALWSATI